MDYGLDIATSAVLTNLYRQDVLSSNLANLNTVGYKPSVPDVRQRDAVREEDGLYNLPSDLLLEKLGAGVVPAPTRIAFSQGAIDTTGNDLDLAIDGDGFLAVQDGSRTALTRDGRLSLDADGRLVLASTGSPVLDTASRPITLPPGEHVGISSSGDISVDGVPVAALRFVNVADTSALIKQGAGLFNTDALAPGAMLPATGRIVQGAVESSSVNEIRTLMQIQAANGAVSTSVRLLGYMDRMSERAINTFGRLG
ncbi:MAG: flagellar hook-basal body protein [Phycisphaerales bacterium]